MSPQPSRPNTDDKVLALGLPSGDMLRLGYPVSPSGSTPSDRAQLLADALMIVEAVRLGDIIYVAPVPPVPFEDRHPVGDADVQAYYEAFRRFQAALNAPVLDLCAVHLAMYEGALVASKTLTLPGQPNELNYIPQWTDKQIIAKSAAPISNLLEWIRPDSILMMPAVVDKILADLQARFNA